jgi:hypothetical protein
VLTGSKARGINEQIGRLEYTIFTESKAMTFHDLALEYDV